MPSARACLSRTPPWRARARGIPVVGDIQLFAEALSGEPRPLIVAITGTNGKSTVTALVGAMCRGAGMDCEIAGNIGPAALDALMRRRDQAREPRAWALELSSFQLEATSSLSADVAAVLNLSEDHLDRYAGMPEYAAAKQRVLFGSGVQVLNRGDPWSIGMAVHGRRTVTFGLDAPEAPTAYGMIERDGCLWLAQGESALMRADELRLSGLHNASNALAALAMCRAIGLPFEPLLQALKEFRGLPHRVELVAEAFGIRFFDDSKGTNVGSTVAALAGLMGNAGAKRGKTVLIAGGEGKSQDFAPLALAARGAARGVVLIGRDAPLIEQALTGSGVPVRRAADMEEAVAVAVSIADPGDAVLLSPACASFDMFRNYEHRGEVFREAVRKLVDVRAH